MHLWSLQSLLLGASQVRGRVTSQNRHTSSTLKLLPGLAVGLFLPLPLLFIPHATLESRVTTPGPHQHQLSNGETQTAAKLLTAAMIPTAMTVQINPKLLVQHPKPHSLNLLGYKEEVFVPTLWQLARTSCPSTARVPIPSSPQAPTFSSPKLSHSFQQHCLPGTPRPQHETASPFTSMVDVSIPVSTPSAHASPQSTLIMSI